MKRDRTVASGSTISGGGAILVSPSCVQETGSGTEGATAAVARARTQEYLLERRMFRRLSSGEVIDRDWTRFSFPTTWHYDVLRGLDYLRRAGVEPDERVAETVGLGRSVGIRTGDGSSTRLTPIRSTSTWKAGPASRAAGTRCARPECCAGIQRTESCF